MRPSTSADAFSMDTGPDGGRVMALDSMPETLEDIVGNLDRARV